MLELTVVVHQYGGRKESKHLELTLAIYRQLIISTEQISIYISTFPNALTSKKTQNHD